MVTGHGAGTPFGACILLASIWLRSDYSTWQWPGQIIFAGVESRTNNITTPKMPDETSMWETVDQSARAGPRNEADSTTWRPIVQNRHPKTNCQVGILGAHNGERPTRHDANHAGRYCHGTGPSLHRLTHNQGSRSGGPWRAHTNLTTQLRRLTNESRAKSRQHSLTQASRARTAMCQSLDPPHGISITLTWRYKSLTSGNTTPSYTRPTRQATSRANLNGVERRTRVSNVCQVPKPVVTHIGRELGWGLHGQITSNLTKSNKWTTIKCDWNHKVTKCASYWRSGDTGENPKSPTERGKLNINYLPEQRLLNRIVAPTSYQFLTRANPHALSPNSRQLTIFVVSRFTPIHTPPEVGGVSTNQATEKGDKSGSGRGQLGSRPGQCWHNLQTFCGRWPRSSSVFWQNSNFYTIAHYYRSSINTTPILNILSVNFSRIHILSLS